MPLDALKGARVRPRLRRRPPRRRGARHGSPPGRRRCRWRWAAPAPGHEDGPAPPALHRDDARPPGARPVAAGWRPTRARHGRRPSTRRRGPCSDAAEQDHGEELFGPAEGLHATYRMIQDEVLEEAWRAGGKLREPRLDTYIDVTAAVGRFLELVKLAGLIQRPGEEPVAEALPAINELLEHAVSPEQREALADSGSRRLPARRGGSGQAAPRADRRARRAVAGGVPAPPGRGPRPVGDRHRALPDLPAQVQVRAGLRHPAGDDDQPALRDRHPPGARALPLTGHGPARRRSAGRGRRKPPAADGAVRAPPGGRPGSARPTTSSSSASAPSRRCGATTRARHPAARSPRWVERKFDFRIGPHHLRGRVDRVDELPSGGYELIDYKTGDPKPQRGARGRRPAGDLPARGARGLEARRGRRQLLVRARRREGRGRRLARRPGAGREHGAGGRRGDPRPGLRAAPLAGDLLLVRLPADLPGHRGLARRPARGRCWRRNRSKSWARASPEGRSSSSSSCSACSSSRRWTSSSISGLAATAFG